MFPGQPEEGDDPEGSPGQTREAQRQHAPGLEEPVRGLQVCWAGGVWAAGGMQTVIPQRLAVPSEGVSLQQESSGRSFLTRPPAEAAAPPADSDISDQLLKMIFTCSLDPS